MKSPWKYVITEVIIVIIGIVIAFSINNWSANYQDQKALKANLISIESDLLEDQKNIEQIVSRQSQKIKDLSKIKSLLTQPAIDWEQVAQLFSVQQSSPTFYPISSTFQSTLNSRKFDLIRDLELKKELFHVYEFTYKRAVYNGQLYDQSHIRYFDQNLIEYVDFDTRQIVNKTALQQPEITNALSYLINEARSYIKLLEGVRAENTKLVARLKG